jgi:hypothetical protein
MAVVWRRARRDFTFKGESYRAGQVFAVPPIVAVQMRNRVDKAKAPPVPVRPEAMPRRRGARTIAEPPPVDPQPVVDDVKPVIEDDNGSNEPDDD